MGFLGVLPPLPLLPTKPDTAARCSPADCLGFLDEMHAGIRAQYVPGALALLDADADLRRHFYATEGRIDELARVAGGPADADFRAAVEAHAAVWRELIARYRARQERQADPDTGPPR